MLKQGSEDWVGNSILERAFQVVGICVKDVRKEILKGKDQSRKNAAARVSKGQIVLAF